MKERLNLSRWALEHIPFIRYLIVVLLLGGIIFTLMDPWVTKK
jgi:hypothetical protein